MWKKGKRILSCILVLVLLLTIANGEQIFVQADSGSAVKTETDKTGNVNQENSEQKRTSQAKEQTEKEEESTKATEKKEESVKEEKDSQEGEKESDSKEEGMKEGRTETEPEENPEENKTNEDKIKEDKTNKNRTETEPEENTQEAEESSTAAENKSEDSSSETEPAEENEAATEMTETSTEKKEDLSREEKEYIPESQPDGVNIKAYAKADAFPEGTRMKVGKLSKNELGNAENILKKDNVEYDGLFGYDISFYDKSGKEVEPVKGKVRVVMQLSANIVPEEADMETLTVQHLAEAGKGYNVEKVASASSGTVKVGSDKIRAEYTVNSFSDFVVTYSYVNTSSWKKEVRFYINKYSYIANSTAGGSSTMEDNFTGSVATATVTMPENADNYNYTIEEAADGKSKAYIVIQGNKTGSAYEVDKTIRDLAVNGYDGFKISSIPSDASVLASIKSGNVDVQVNGKTIKSDELTTDNFQVRWYVFKYNPTDQWHIDGILVPKSGRLQITKTFSGLTEKEVNQLKNQFEIDVRGATTYGENQYSLSLDKGKASDNGMTYTWTVDVYSTTYTVKEQNMNVENWTRETKYSVNPDTSITTGSVTDAPYDDAKGFSITCVTRATDTGTSVNQSVALNNHYTRKTVPLKLRKNIVADGIKADDMNNLKFEIKDSDNKVVKEISFSEFTKKSDGSYEYLRDTDKFMKAGETYTVTEKNTDVDGYKFNNEEKECSKTITVGAADSEEEISFTNTYTQPTLTVKKLVTGNAPEKEKEFHFSLQLIKNNKKWEKELQKMNDDKISAQKDQYEFTLKDGESIQLKVPYGYTYTLTETDAEAYKTYIGNEDTTKKNYKNLAEKAEKNATGILGDSDSHVVFVNEKDIVPPTGISTTMTVWLLMTGVTLALGAVFLLFEIRRKRFTI